MISIGGLYKTKRPFCEGTTVRLVYKIAYGQSLDEERAREFFGNSTFGVRIGMRPAKCEKLVLKKLGRPGYIIVPTQRQHKYLTPIREYDSPPEHFSCLSSTSTTEKEKEKEAHMEKTIYVVSALRHDYNNLGMLKKHETEKDAIEAAKGILDSRVKEGKPLMPFYVLKTVAVVATEMTPVTVKRFKK